MSTTKNLSNSISNKQGKSKTEERREQTSYELEQQHRHEFLTFSPPCISHLEFKMLAVQKCQSVQFSSVAQSCPTLRPHEPQHARPPCLSPTPGVHPNPCPLSRWCHPTISSSVVPLSSAFSLCKHQGLFKWVSSSHQVPKVLELQLQHQSYQWTPRTDLL